MYKNLFAILVLITSLAACNVAGPPDGHTVSSDVVNPYKAIGTEPFWAVTMDEDEIVVQHMGRNTESYVRPTEQIEGHNYIYELNAEDRFIITQLTPDQFWSDGMSDRKYPDQVKLIQNGITYHGCGRHGF